MKFKLLESSHGFYIITYNPETNDVYYWVTEKQLFSIHESDAHIYNDLTSCLRDLHNVKIAAMRKYSPYGNIAKKIVDNTYAVEIGTGKTWNDLDDSKYPINIADKIEPSIDTVSFKDINYDQELAPLTMDFFD